MEVNVMPDFTRIIAQIISTLLFISIPVVVVFLIVKLSNSKNKPNNDSIKNLEKRIEDLENTVDKK